MEDRIEYKFNNYDVVTASNVQSPWSLSVWRYFHYCSVMSFLLRHPTPNEYEHRKRNAASGPRSDWAYESLDHVVTVLRKPPRQSAPGHISSASL